MNNKGRQLRRTLDGNDPFMTGGHQVVRPRSYRKDAPSWILNDRKIRAFLLQSFPKLATDEKQRHAAGRWAAVIHLHYRMGYTRKQIAEELGSTCCRIDTVIRSIVRASLGLRTNGTGKKGGKRTGRPRKLSA